MISRVSAIATGSRGRGAVGSAPWPASPMRVWTVAERRRHALPVRAHGVPVELQLGCPVADLLDDLEHRTTADFRPVIEGHGDRLVALDTGPDLAPDPREANSVAALADPAGQEIQRVIRRRCRGMPGDPELHRSSVAPPPHPRKRCRSAIPDPVRVSRCPSGRSKCEAMAPWAPSRSTGPRS